MSGLRHEQDTYRLRGLIYKVRNELKRGWSEHIYHQALVQVLNEQHIPVDYKPRRMLSHRGIEVHVFEPDLIVWNKIILELKVLPFDTQFAGEHYAQLLHYLKFFGKDLGLLINFASSPIQIKRIIWDEAKLDIMEDYHFIVPHLADADKQLLRQIRQHILAIARQYALGYPETVYRKIAAIELTYHKLTCVSNVEISAKRNNSLLATHTTNHLLIADHYLLHIRSLLEHPTQYDFACTKTYLKSLGLQFGLIVNFGHKQLQIYGVKAE